MFLFNTSYNISMVTSCMKNFIYKSNKANGDYVLLFVPSKISFHVTMSHYFIHMEDKPRERDGKAISPQWVHLLRSGKRVSGATGLL